MAGRTEGLRRGSPRGWAVVALLACAQGVNQADKAVLGLAAEPIMRELNLSTAQYGLVASSLFVSFAAGGLAVAFLAAPRFAPRTIIWAMLLVWSISQLPIALAASLPILVVSRMILGAGEGGATPTFLNMCHEWFPDERRALPGALILSGGTVGALIAAPALTHVIATFGWRSAFLLCGLVGFATMAGWLLIGRDGPYSARAAIAIVRPASGSTLGALLRHPAVLRSFAVGFSAFWVVGFTVAWLAPFIRSLPDISLLSSGWILSLVYLAQGAMVLAVAGTSEWLLRRGHRPRLARDGMIAACLMMSAVCFTAITLVSATPMCVLLIAVATGLPNAVFALLAATVSAAAPAAERYRLVTIVMSGITVAALVSPPLIGVLIDPARADGWRSALLVMAAIGAAGAVAGIARKPTAKV